MLNSRFRALVAVMAFATAALAACGGGGGDDKRQRPAGQRHLTRASLDLLANGEPIVDGTAKDTASAYVDVDAGSPSLQVNDATTDAGPGRHRADGDRGSEVRARRLRERRRGAHGGDLRGHRPCLRPTRRSFASSMPPPTPARSTSTSPTPACRHHRPCVADLHLHRLDLGAGEQLRVVRRPVPRRRHLPDSRHRRGQPVGPAPRHPAGHPAQPAGRDRDPHAHRRRHAGERVGPDQRVRRYGGSTAPPPTPAPGSACSPRSRTAPRSRPLPSRPARARRSASAPMSSRRRSAPMSTSRRAARSASR